MAYEDVTTPGEPDLAPKKRKAAKPTREVLQDLIPERSVGHVEYDEHAASPGPAIGDYYLSDERARGRERRGRH